MRARTFSLGCLIALAGSTAAHAQSSTPPAAPPAAPAAPAAEPAAPPAPAAASAEPATTTEHPAGTPPTEPNPYAPGSPEAVEAARNAARIRRERADMQVMLARARAAHDNANAPADEPEPERRHGDAGAALALGLSFEAPWYTDPGYDVFAEDDAAARFGLWAAYDIAELREDTFAALEVGWGTETEEGQVLGVASTQLTTQVAYAGATVRWVPLSWLQPHVRLAGGAAFVDAELRSGQTFHDGAGGFFKDMISPFGSAGLGLTLRTATRTFEDRNGRLASLSFGLMLEGGYTLAAPLDVKLDGPGPSARDIPLAEPSLGELKRSGPYIRVSLVGRI